MPDPTALAEALRERYLVERELGRGGMATVYLARDLKHDRPVALKVLLPDLAASVGPERFQREIHFAARLQHPHILTVLDSGEAMGQLWFTMPYVRGESLRDRLRREPQLPVDEALRITREAGQALAYAHKEGVVHRDVKPENILLSEDGSTLVADFGIARALGGNQQLTQTGLAVGTPAYMSPEQASGGAVDGRSDLYSLACVCYEMLAGEPPYTGATAQVIIAKRFTDPVPDVRRLRPAVPEQVDLAIQRALAAVPGDRFTTVTQFMQVLAPPGGTTISPPVRRRIPRLPVGLATLALGFALGLGVLFAWYRTRGATTAGSPKHLAVLPFENLGDSADAYFAEGITDAVRGKLAAVPGVQVVASTSSERYRHTTKSPAEIGRELGVDYLLVGKVRWAKVADGASRVQVSPELVQVATGSTKWAESFDAALTDVFQVQRDVAARVASELDVALGAEQQQALAARPTKSLPAYDAYLRGREMFRSSLQSARVHAAAAQFEDAVRLDPSFAEAWAGLAIARASLSWEWGLNEELPGAVAAADRALSLAPDIAETHRARGYVHYYGRRAYDSALAELRRAEALAPNDPGILVPIGFVLRRQGKWPEAIRTFERALALDPQSMDVVYGSLALSYGTTRQFDKAEAMLERAIGLDASVPGAHSFLALLHILRDSDTTRAAHDVERGAARAGFAHVVFANGRQLTRILGPRYAAPLLRVTSAVVAQPTPGAADELDRLSFFVAKATLLRQLGHGAEARANFDSARTEIEAMPTAALDRVSSQQGAIQSLQGLAYAGLGRRDDAVRYGRRGVDVAETPGDAWTSQDRREDLAEIYLIIGDRDRALDELERLLAVPSRVGPASVRLDPLWASLRGNPRFERLVAR